MKRQSTRLNFRNYRHKVNSTIAFLSKQYKDGQKLAIKITLATVLLALSNHCAFAQDASQGLFSDIDALERRFQAPGDPSAPLVNRLTALEQRVFGAPRSGSMVQRFQSIRSAAAEMPPQQPAQVQGSPAGNMGWSPGSANGAAPGWTPVQGAPNQSMNINSGSGWIPGATPNKMPTPATTEIPAPHQDKPPEPSWQQAPHHPTRVNTFAAPNKAQPNPLTSNSIPPISTREAGLMRKNYEPDALPLLNAFPPNLVHMEPDNTALIAKPDYLAEVEKASKGKAIRFKSMPIPVYIQPYPDKGFVNCVVRAFESWEMRTDGVVKFSQIENPNQARIQVVWKHLGGNKDASGCLLGAHTILKYTNHGNGSLSLMSVGAVPVPIYIPRMGPKYSVPPQVMEVNLDLIMTKDFAVRYACLQNIVTHELGHALGLLGHSPNVTDIMYPVTDEHSRLSQRDVNTVIKLYNQKCDIPL